MAKARSNTISYDIRSPTTGEERLVVERCFVKSTRVGNRYVTASKGYALFDHKGRRYERISNNIVACADSGDRFHVVGQADSIRKATA